MSTPTLLSRAKAWKDGDTLDTLKNLGQDITDTYNTLTVGDDCTEIKAVCNELLSRDKIPLGFRALLLSYTATMGDPADLKVCRQGLEEAKSVAVESNLCSQGMVDVEALVEAIDEALAQIASIEPAPEDSPPKRKTRRTRSSRA